MSCIFDDEANVMLFSKFDSNGSILPRRDFDRIIHIVAKRARRGLRCKRVTAAVLLPRIHDGGWRLQARLTSDCHSNVAGFLTHWRLGKAQRSLMFWHSAALKVGSWHGAATGTVAISLPPTV